jgi:hypothetical protein
MNKIFKQQLKLVTGLLLVAPLLLFVFYTLTFRGTMPKSFFEELVIDSEEFAVKIKSQQFSLSPQMNDSSFRVNSIRSFAECLRKADSKFLSLGKNSEDHDIRIYFDSQAISYEIKVFWRPSKSIAYVMSYADKTTKDSLQSERLKSGNYGGVCLHNSLQVMLKKT